MNILIPNHFPLEGSGSGIYAQNVALELTRLGHKVIAIAPDHEQNTGFDFEVRNIICSNGSNENCDLPFNFPCFTTHPKSNKTYYELTEKERDLYIETYQRFIDQAIKDFSPDIIHVMHLWVATFCASRTSVPYVATVHGTDLMGYENDERYHEIAEAGVAGAKKLISISNQITQKTKELFNVPDEKLETILNGFSTDIFKKLDEITKSDIFNEFNIPETEYVVSFVGKLTDFKGIDVLIDAAKGRHKELGSVSTLIVGMGGLLEQLLKQAEENCLKNLHFLGHQTQQTVARINNAADLAAFPSRIEPFGLVAIEAMACGTPVVTTNQGGFPDFVNDKVGALVDVDSADQLAEAIIDNINSKDTKGKAAAKYAADGFSWKQKVGEFYKLYESVIS